MSIHDTGINNSVYNIYIYYVCINIYIYMNHMISG